MKGEKSTFKPTLQITFFSFIGIIIGFSTQLIIAFYFGTSFERDAYFVAIIIPTYISSIFIGSFGIIFLPKVVDILKKENQFILTNFISTVFCAIFGLLVLIALICLLIPNQVIQIVAPGFDLDKIEFTVQLLIILIPAIIFNVLGNFLASLYQIQHKFVRPAIAPILLLITSLVSVVLFSKTLGIYSLALGYLLGSFFSFIIQLPILKKYNFKLYVDLKNKDVILFIRLAFPLLLTGIIFRSNVVFERVIASGLEQGSVSYLGYSTQIITVLGTLIASGIVTSTYPILSKLWSNNNITEFSKMFLQTLRIILLISIPISISLIFFGEQFVMYIFERGAFNSNDTLLVSKALVWGIGAFIFQGLGGVVAKILYISKHTIISSVISVLEILIYVCLGFLLSRKLSFVGLAMALSISSGFNIIVSLYFINKKVVKIDFIPLCVELVKILINSVISILVVYYIFYCVYSSNSFLSLIISFIFGLLFFLGFGIFIKIQDVLKIKSKIIGSK
tara:strand:+ start:2950 stop:4470 length:1521 start_codon:yes stop_codon:yes gene_type:complete